MKLSSHWSKITDRHVRLARLILCNVKKNFCYRRYCTRRIL